MPGLAPGSPAWPCPTTRTRWPVSTPPGIATETVRRSGRRPWPRQVRQRFSTTMPRPRHVGHGDVRTICPNIVRATCCTWPWPWHVGQRVGCDGGSAPEPWQWSQVASTSTTTSLRAPNAASTRSSSMSACASAPAIGPRRCAVAPPPNRSSPNSIEKMSAMFPLW